MGTRILFAVGMTIADRPPHRSARALLRIRLLLRRSGGEAGMGIGMQNAVLGNPTVKMGNKRLQRTWAR
jgi:hypothetical protein